MGGFEEYAQYDGLGLAELVLQREVTPEELVEEAIRRIEALNPRLNAVIHPMYELARADAIRGVPEGPFRGVPFLLKDLLSTYANVPTRSGSRLLRDFVPDCDSELVRRYKAAGLIVVGKTNTPEFGLVPFTEPQLFGVTNNPWDLTRTAGGSSGGSAAAVAACLVPMAHGGDGGGSIRIPASCCGLFGLKPSRGRTPLGPWMAEAWHGLTIEHVLTRSVRDSAAMLDATAGHDVGAPYCAPSAYRPFLEEVGADPGRLRIAFTAEPFLPSTVHEDCVRGLEATVGLLQELGHEVTEDAPTFDGTAFARAFVTMLCGETAAEIAEAERLVGRKATFSDLEPSTWAVALIGKTISADDYCTAIRLLQRTGRELGRFFEDYDVMLTPTLAWPPFVSGSLQPSASETLAMKVLGPLKAGSLVKAVAGIDALANKVFEFMPFTPVFNATGQPAMSVPLHWNADGLPIGMHFVGRYGDEATLYRLAGQLEQASGWFDRTPPIAAEV